MIIVSQAIRTSFKWSFFLIWKLRIASLHIKLDQPLGGRYHTFRKNPGQPGLCCNNWNARKQARQPRRCAASHVCLEGGLRLSSPFPGVRRDQIEQLWDGSGRLGQTRRGLMQRERKSRQVAFGISSFPRAHTRERGRRSASRHHCA